MRILVLLCLVALSACGAAKPYAYRDDKEMGSRPGLLTGPAGEFTVYRR